jgi:hypothetical protein
MALLLGAMTYSSASALLLNTAPIPSSPVAVYAYQSMIGIGIIPSARKIAAENRGTMKQQVASGSMAVGTIEEMDGRTSSTWRMSRAEGLPTSRTFSRQLHRDMATTREVAMDWKWRHWEDGEEMGTQSKNGGCRDRPGPKKANVIHESHLNVRHEYEADQAQKGARPLLSRTSKGELTGSVWPGIPSRDWGNHAVHQPPSRGDKIQMCENTLNH